MSPLKSALVLTAALLLAACASQTAAPAADLERQAAEIDSLCLRSAGAPADRGTRFTREDALADELYATALPLPDEGELFALAEDQEAEDRLRSLRAKEAVIDRRARFLGYDD